MRQLPKDIPRLAYDTEVVALERKHENKFGAKQHCGQLAFDMPKERLVVDRLPRM
jgi:hypothetical protein